MNSKAITRTSAAVLGLMIISLSGCVWHDHGRHRGNDDYRHRDWWGKRDHNEGFHHGRNRPDKVIIRVDDGGRRGKYRGRDHDDHDDHGRHGNHHRDRD